VVSGDSRASSRRDLLLLADRPSPIMLVLVLVDGDGGVVVVVPVARRAGDRLRLRRQVVRVRACHSRAAVRACSKTAVKAGGGDDDGC
jgi:hypothetical protein